MVLIQACGDLDILKTYTVTFEEDGGTPAPKAQTIIYSDTVAVPQLMSREGYSFRGWYIDSQRTKAYIFSTPVRGNLTLYAKWEPNSVNAHTVFFSTIEGIPSPDPQKINHGDKAKAPPAILRAGYLFAGWCVDKRMTKVYDFSAPVTTNLDLHASWISFRFTVDDNPEMALADEDRKDLFASIFDMATNTIIVTVSAYIHPDKLTKAQYIGRNVYGRSILFADVVSSDTIKQEQDTSVYTFMPNRPFIHKVIMKRANLAVIPDPNFRNRLDINWMKKGLLHIQRVKKHTLPLKLDNNPVEKALQKITSLKGIEFFTSVKTVTVKDNLLAKANFSKNTCLQSLDIVRNRLTSLIVSPSVSVLHCEDNQLNQLDVSANTQLRILSCQNNSLRELRLSANTALVSLNCSKNDITHLNLSLHTQLTEVNCLANKMVYLDIRGINSVAPPRMLILGISEGTDPNRQNPVMHLRVNTAIKDARPIVKAKQKRGKAIFIAVYDEKGIKITADYTPVEAGSGDSSGAGG